MALFSVKPAIVQKDVAATFTIDYAELATYSAVPAGYYKNTSNWKSVFVRMKHKYSNQKAMLQFDLPGTSADLLLTDAARAGDWELDHLMIRDFDKGEVVLKRADIPSVGDIDFITRSGATHGDIYVPAGGDVTIPSGGKRQYGDFVVEAGGVLRLADGGGITEVEVLETCLINGTIMANNGKHTGGTWNSTSVLGEALAHSVTQKDGGNGGEGEGVAGGTSLLEDYSSSDAFNGWHIDSALTPAVWFLADSSFNLTEVEFFIKTQIDTFATVTATLYEGVLQGSNYRPTGAALGSAVFDPAGSNNDAYRTFDFGSIPLSGGTNYVITLSSTETVAVPCQLDSGVSLGSGTGFGFAFSSVGSAGPSDSWNTAITGYPNFRVYEAGINPGGDGGASGAGVREPATGANAAVVGSNGVSVGGGQAYWRWQGATNLATTADTQTSVVIGAYTYFRDAYNTTAGPFDWYDIYRIENNVVTGNGGGGGRSFQFGALGGGDASPTLAGQGAGQDDAAADEYGEDGADSLTASEAANGGFRGAHGQGFYLKARKIQGTGTIEASGQKGGDGGDGAEYDSGGILYGNGAGGGGAGGDGGAVWLRHQIGTPALTINVAGGAAGSRGLGGFGSAEAEHGTVGSVGSTDTATFS